MPSDGESSTPVARRKSGRVRKTIERLDPSRNKAGGIQKRGDIEGNEAASSDDDDQNENPEQDSSSEPESVEDEDDEDFKAPTKPTTAGRKRKSIARAANGSSQKKRRQDSSSPTGTKTAATQARKPRARKARANEAEGDVDGHDVVKKATTSKDFPIEDDNELFNAVKSPHAALQTSVDDWIESYREEPGRAMAEMVNFVLRCCGCNASVDEHQAEDENGIVENLKDIVDEFKQGSDHAYPLVSKSKGYKKFRASLGQFLLKLLSAAAEDILFSTPFYEQFQAWTHALSSSQIRALRHTATVIVLLSIDALTILEDRIRKEHGQAIRAKEAEEKKGRKDKSRLRDLDKQVQEIHTRLETVEALEEEAYTSVFVNRYRDADYAIRAECIASLGNWMKLNPDHWIDGNYLRYIGWVLSDESKEARRDSVRALSTLYAKEQYIGKLHHFTDRFKGQLVDMAVGEHDLAVRLQAIQVVRQIDGHGLLEEDQRDKVARLVFEKEKRVRIGAAELFKNVLEEEVEQRRTEMESERKTSRGRKVGTKQAKEGNAELEVQLELKVIAELLVKYGKALDGAGPDAEDQDQDGDSPAPSYRRKEEQALTSVSDLVDVNAHRSRNTLAAEALWDSVEVVQDWETLLSYLLKDHSEHGTDGKVNGKEKVSGKKNLRGEDPDREDDPAAISERDADTPDSDLPSSIKLTEEEETLMIEILITCLAKLAQATSSTKKDKEQDEEVQAEIARAVVDALPRLFAKHQTFPVRMIDILAIPRLIQLELYHDESNAYETLWDAVKKQFLKHAEADVLEQAIRTFSHLLGATDLSAETQNMMPELEEALLAALRQCVGGKDIESANFEEDEISDLTACVARIDKLSKLRRISSLEDDDGGKQTRAWDILDSIVNRGRLGYPEEDKMIQYALSTLGLHVSWQLQIVAHEARESGAVELLTLDLIAARRSSLLEKCEEFAVGNETNAVEGVKETALSVLLDIHFASAAITATHNDPEKHLAALHLECPDELQARCAGYVEAEIERFADKLAQEKQHEEEEEGGTDAAESSDSGSDTEIESLTKKVKRKKATKGRGKAAQVKKPSNPKAKTPMAIRAENARQQARLISAQRFERIISGFTRAIHLGIFDIRHSSLLFKYWARLGPTFDDFARLLMHDLRDEGNYGDGGDVAATVVVESLQGAFEIYLDSPETSDEYLVSLGRNLLQVAVVRGAQLAIVSTIPAENHLRIHIESLNFIVKKVKLSIDTKRHDDRNKALNIFKALAHLVFGLDGRSALKAKTHLDSLLDDNGIDVSVTSKTWEPLRAYQKRLITNMAKDPSIKSRAQAQTKSNAKEGKGRTRRKAKQTDADDRDSEHEEEAGGRSSPTGTPSRSATRGQKRRTPDIAADEVQGGEQDGRTADPARKRIRAEDSAEPDDLEAGGTASRLDPDAHEEGLSHGLRGAEGDDVGDLDNTMTGDGDGSDMDREELSRSTRELSVESSMSLSDVKKKKRGRA